MTEAFATAQHALAPAIAAMLVHSLWQDALLAAAAALVLRAMAHASAAQRHAVAMGFLAAMVLVPALTAPRLDIEGTMFLRDNSPVTTLVIVLWLLGLGLALTHHVNGLRTISAMERGGWEALPEPWRRRAEHLQGALGIARAVAVRLSDEVLLPCTARLLRPIIWLPLSLMTRASVAQLEALLAHELAHVARKDWLWNGIQCVIECLLFFHPAVWWLSRRIREEREHACDDLAVAAAGGNAIALAEALLALERARQASRRLALAADGGTLVQRVSRLISRSPSREPWRGPLVLGMLTVATALLVAEMGLAGSRLPELNVESSTSGVLGPGDYREITANGPDKVRQYRASIDARGRLIEVYLEDGRVHPIDADTRRWIDEVGALSPSSSSASPAADDSGAAR